MKAEKILSFLSTQNDPQPLHVIAKKTEKTNATVSKILGTLEIIEYVYRNTDRKTYTIGNGLIKYASQYLANVDISKIAYPYLKKLHAYLDETVHLSIREGDEIMYINKWNLFVPLW